MENLKLYPYNLGSESAKGLAQVLNVTRVRPDGNYVPRMGHTIINWGNSTSPDWAGTAARRANRILNKPEAVGNASNKLNAFRLLQAAGVRTPDFTTNYLEAKRWLEAGFTVVERHKLNASSGEGVRIVSYDDNTASSQLQTAPLYTKYIYKQSEFRVHIFRGNVIDYIQKKKRNGAEDLPNFDRFVYSAERGWVFVREGATQVESVKQLAISAVRALGLDFGAVDVILIDNVPYVLEVNTAPGLMGTTLIKYANAIRQFMGASPLEAGVVNNYMATVRGRELEEGPTETAPAARAAQARGGYIPAPPRPQQPQQQMAVQMDGDMVTLRLDRDTARKLKALLNTVI